MSEEKKETLQEKHARLSEAKAKREEARREKLLERDVEKMELVERFERELGTQGSDWEIYDSGQLDDPLIVVKRPLMVQFNKYEQSKMEPTDRFDFVAPSVAYPTLDEWKATREKRIAIEVQLANLMAKLVGMNLEANRGK